ncbi:unnamed protein product [Debaryomyces fabryi]|nr:unnamed protein product [Debaryomyces fabryi]
MAKFIKSGKVGMYQDYRFNSNHLDGNSEQNSGYGVKF